MDTSEVNFGITLLTGLEDEHSAVLSDELLPACLLYLLNDLYEQLLLPYLINSQGGRSISLGSFAVPDVYPVNTCCKYNRADCTVCMYQVTDTSLT